PTSGRWRFTVRRNLGEEIALGPAKSSLTWIAIGAVIIAIAIILALIGGIVWLVRRSCPRPVRSNRPRARPTRRFDARPSVGPVRCCGVRRRGHGRRLCSEGHRGQAGKTGEHDA